MSYKHTWVTYGITFIGAIVTFFVGYEYHGLAWQHSRTFSNFDVDVTNFFTGDEEFAFGEDSGLDTTDQAGTVVISWFLTVIILPILIGFVQSVDKCCTCCPTKCLPVVERTKLDVEKME